MGKRQVVRIAMDLVGYVGILLGFVTLGMINWLTLSLAFVSLIGWTIVVQLLYPVLEEEQLEREKWKEIVK